MTGYTAPPLPDAEARQICTDCGLSRMKLSKSCGMACQFIKPDYPEMERVVQGRARRPDELFFGPVISMHKAALDKPAEGAQWTGITTRLAQKLLETGTVDAVLTVGPHPNDKWRPQPIIVTDPAAMPIARGMRMGYAPLLSLLEPAAAAGHKRIVVIGIPCQVYALRRIEKELGFEAIFVIGTPCSDNTTTENFHTFLGTLSAKPETITYLEFRADYHVEIRFEDGTSQDIPFLKLKLSELPDDFFPLSCKTCVDYTNVLSDITVGYMAGEGEQWILVRNARGQGMLDGIKGEMRLDQIGTAGNRRGPVKGFLSNTERAAGGLPLRQMPNFMRGLMAWLMPKIGPRGLEFAKARVEMKAIETVLHLRRQHPKRVKNMIPEHIWDLTAPYDLTPQPDERQDDQAPPKDSLAVK
ncbi:Coenzyme F420 hydrogenase/dehydrogenase, beta subunit C-terminal domain [Litoreibacter roseus]|uniref:Coenzyme F420 hydrogenase subunit beta n=1 Tax=Litoreibacter roseus TaxID=2601869 RepID=A0A6N6JEC5_9RHOB|nr:Coenzyme F420 hydrogenase/dehydrogenase, beta subunit C-terminal domain [Litoreibacter roseus]GFE64703.1 coenzyme F420 hydrogenase subunit beta [Litoreibacter roseus]